MKYKKLLIDMLNSKEYVPLTYNQIIDSNRIFKSCEKEVSEYLEQLIKVQALSILSDGTYSLLKDIVVGKFEIASPKFGFVRPTNIGRDDVFVGERNMNSSFHGDYVLVREMMSARKDKTEGKILSIIEECEDKIVGTLQESEKFGFVRSDNKRISDIFVARRNFNGAKTDQKVVVEITKRPENGKSAEGKIVEVLGHKDDVGVDLISIIKQYNIATEFPDDVIRDCRFILNEIPPKELLDELKYRKDLRHMTIMTIDGDDTKDFDDAVSVEITPEGNYYLGVHIADVTHYAKEGEPLDKEALKRGTSVYMPGRVIPMLPEKLSNGICSLNPKVNRFTLSCFMTIDKEGTVIKSEIFESVIKTVERMTYSNVDKMITRDPEICEQYSHILKDVDVMYELSLILQKKRNDRHAINFDFPEAKIILDEKGKVSDITLRYSTASTQLIEEFMILCNEVVSEYMTKKEIPFLYRVHEVPSDEKQDKFNSFMQVIDPVYKPMELTQKNIREVLREYKDKPEGQQVNSVLLRSLSKAKYTNQCLGHFGLSSVYYSHFTSPIRRYPDLQIHRIVKEYLHSKISDTRKRHLNLLLPEVGKISSETEINAAKCEYETVKYKMCEYMSEKIGEQFEGIVSGATENGIYVSLPNSIEGFVLSEDIQTEEEHYLFNEDTFSYICVQDKTKKYTFGTPVKVEVLSVDMGKRKITFTLIHENTETQI